MTVSCDICGLKYQDTRGLSSHIRNKHKDVKPDDSNDITPNPDEVGIIKTPTVPIKMPITMKEAMFQEAMKESDDDVDDYYKKYLIEKFKTKILREQTRRERMTQEVKEDQTKAFNKMLEMAGGDEYDDIGDEPEPEKKSNIEGEVLKQLLPYLGQLKPKAPAPAPASEVW